MSETSPQEVSAADIQAQQATELANEMAIALNQPQLASQQNNQPQSSESQVSEQQQGQVAEQQSAEQQQQPVVIPFETFKEKYGYENPEDAFREIEELRALKANPQSAFKFEDETSEKLAKAWQAGKRKEVYNYLAQNEKLESLTTVDIDKENAADIIKLGMQLKYKDLTPQEIDYKFNKQFALPKKPVMGIDELEDEFAERENAWKEQVADIEMNKIIEAKLARPELEASKSKLQLPTIESDVDEGYAQYRKNIEEGSKASLEATEAYKKFTPKALETKLNFTDEPNKIAFDFQYEPDAESFSEAVEIASDMKKFLGLFKNQDGTPNRQKFLDMVYFGLNKEKVIMNALNQSKNETIKSSLPDNNREQRFTPQQQDSGELHRYMQQAGVV